MAAGDRIAAIMETEKAQPLGVATLDGDGKVPAAQLHAGEAGGVASLGSNGKVPVAQLPMDSAPTSGSGNPVSSGGVYTALTGKADNADVTATQNMIATVEQTATASKAYAVGEYLVYQGKLYRVTSAIAAGGAINPGGNCESTNVDAALAGKADAAVVNELNDRILSVKFANPGSVTIEKTAGIPSYGFFFILGFYQSIGNVTVLIRISNNAISAIKDMITGETYSGANPAFGFSNGVLTITNTSTSSGNNYLTCIIA